MRNRTLHAAGTPPSIPDFEPVPRKYRHDGWTPERQRAFIAALADTGSVTRAAAAVNMGLEGCYTLRRAPGAEGLRRAWDIALGFGVGKLKDIAFERAIEGELVPVFHRGKLQGFRRKRNDALLMFCLRHYGQDANGRRTTVNYFKTVAAAGSGGEGAAAATTTMRVTSGERPEPAALAAREDALAGELAGFDGVRLDAEAQAQIARALEDCAARARAADAVIEQGGEGEIDAQLADPDTAFVPVGERAHPYRATFESGFALEEQVEFVPGEPSWRMAGAEVPEWVPAEALPAPAPDEGVAEVKRPRRRRKPA